MCDFGWCSMALTISFWNGILPEWSKGADLRSARRLSAWVQTPQVPCYASNSRMLDACGSQLPSALCRPAHFARRLPPPSPQIYIRCTMQWTNYHAPVCAAIVIALSKRNRIHHPPHTQSTTPSILHTATVPTVKWITTVIPTPPIG